MHLHLPNDIKVLAPSEKQIAYTKENFGMAIAEVLAKEATHGMYQILGAIETLVGDKLLRQRPTTVAERLVFGGTWLAREVQNGGFDQHFFNTAGDFWKDVLDGLVLIGDRDGLADFQEVLSIFPDSTPSSERFRRQRQLNALERENEEQRSAHFERVSQKYYVKPFLNWEMVLSYVKSHPDQFSF
ncbi:MAG: DUF4375 domain-containing protein [Verrucomicrobiota bacterium]